MDLSGSHSAEESESCPGGPQRGVSLQSTPLQPPDASGPLRLTSC